MLQRDPKHKEISIFGSLLPLVENLLYSGIEISRVLQLDPKHKFGSPFHLIENLLVIFRH
jgi:hypothetical protein